MDAPNIVEQWKSEEAAMRARLIPTGVASKEKLRGRLGGQVGIAEGRLTDANGKLYAFATTTCLVFAI